MRKRIPTLVVVSLAILASGCQQALSPAPEQPVAITSEPARLPLAEAEQTAARPAVPLTSMQAKAAGLHDGTYNVRSPGLVFQRHGAGLHPRMPDAVDRERYGDFESHGITSVASQPVSTFSIDVDTGSYSNVRRILQEGRLPPKDAVRVEELVNYFRYADPAPADQGQPFRVHTALAPAPWNKDRLLLRIALKAREVDVAELPASNLVFLIDVSGSMNSADKLPLLKRSIRLLTRQMDADDRVTFVVYAGAAGVVLEPTAGDQQAKIEVALEALQAGGSTHGSAGIALAYAKARESFIQGGVNRVILATDGDFNVGTVDQRALLDLIEHERRGGIALTTLGFGRGNLNDDLMEQLANHGNGNYAYIDTLLEAQKVLVEQMGGTLLTLAKDVKIQVEFNPARVAEYRLLGYENRMLRREDFNNDRVDAGEIGAGHSVVALYELTPVGSPAGLIDPLRYGTATAPDHAPKTHGDEYAFVRLRYKAPDAGNSELLSHPVTQAARVASLADTTDDFRFSSAVAAFAQHLRGAIHLRDFGYPDILALARGSRGPDHHGYRADFVRLVRLAQSLDQRPAEVAAADDGQR
jgi:Ca-activated chloride channel family protein